MIRTMIFDMGQVMLHWEPSLFTGKLGLSAEDEERLRTETFEREEWRLLDAGTISLEAAMEKIRSRLPMHLQPYVEQLVLGWWELCLSPMEGMAELVGELKEKGMGIYLLSNAAVTLHQYFHRIPGADLFDGIYVSADHQLVKPQPEIYASFLKEFSLNGEECFFIDDRPANIEAAAAAGIRGTIFHGDVRRLRRELREAGISCAL